MEGGSLSPQIGGLWSAWATESMGHQWGEGPEEAEWLSRLTEGGGGDYSCSTCCKGLAHLSFPDWATLGKQKTNKQNLCDSLLFRASKDAAQNYLHGSQDGDLSRWISGSSRRTVWASWGYEKQLLERYSWFLSPLTKKGCHNLLTNLALINNSLSWQSNPSWLKIIINLSKWLNRMPGFSFISSFLLNDVYVCGTVY